MKFSRRRISGLMVTMQVWLLICCACPSSPNLDAATGNNSNLGAPSQQRLQEPDKDDTRNPRFVVLKNFQLMEGLLTKSERGWEFRKGRTTSILSPERVWFVCNEKAEAYWELISRIKATDVEAQVQVLQFCLRYQLFAQAQNQVDILQLLPLKATRLESLHRQVAIARSRAEKWEATRQRNQAIAAQQRLLTDLPTIRPLPPLPVRTQSGLASHAPSLKQARSEVTQVGFEQAVSEKFVEPGTSPLSVPSQAELDRLTDSVPKPAVAFFKRKIEPIMTRSCFAAGCHTPQSETMPVMRLSEMRVMPRRMSQRNMHSALAFADAYTPLESPLLKMAGTPHGGVDKPPIEPRSAEFDRLARWLIAVSNQPYVLHKMPEWMLTEQEKAGMAAMEQQQALIEADRQAALLASEAQDEPEPIDVSEFKSLPPGLLLTDPVPGTTQPAQAEPTIDTKPDEKPIPKMPVGKDPFDPEIFNRQFGKSEPSPQKADDSGGK